MQKFELSKDVENEVSSLNDASLAKKLPYEAPALEKLCDGIKETNFTVFDGMTGGGPEDS